MAISFVYLMTAQIIIYPFKTGSVDIILDILVQIRYSNLMYKIFFVH